MARVYEEESWSLIDFLQQSREEMTNMAHEMVDEQEQLRSASSMLGMHMTSAISDFYRV
jgi:hypothetical protein